MGNNGNSNKSYYDDNDNKTSIYDGKKRMAFIMTMITATRMTTTTRTTTTISITPRTIKTLPMKIASNREEKECQK